MSNTDYMVIHLPNNVLDMETVRDRVEKIGSVKTRKRKDGGYSFYPSGKGRGSLFAAVTPGPRVFVDPTAKDAVYGKTPEVIIGNSKFGDSGTWGGSFNYSVMLKGKKELPEDVEEAIIESYELVK